MPIRDYQDAGKLVDLTPSINSIPNMWGLIGDLGLFQDQGVTQRSIVVESRDDTIGLVGDTPWGTRHAIVGGDDQFVTRAFAIPHHPLDDRIEPADLQGRRAYGTESEAETLANVRLRKLQKIQRSHMITKEFMRMQAIKGTVVTPNGTLLSDLYADFGVTRKEVDFLLGTSTTDLTAKVEEVIAHIQDNMNTGAVVNDILVLCSPEFFSALIAHDTLKEAYKYYSTTNQANGAQFDRDRLGTGLYRTFSHAGLTFIEYRGKYNYQGSSVALIEAGDAYAVPRGESDIFVGYNAPMDHLDFVNTIGEPMYALTEMESTGFGFNIYTEQNYLPIMRRPQAVVKLTTSN